MDTKTPAKTLKKISKPSKNYDTTDDEMTIRSPYKDWDIDRIFISTPDKKESADKKATYFECNIQYNYKLHDGTDMKGPLLVEFPHEEGRCCVSEYGISEIMEKIDDKAPVKEGEEVKRIGTGKYQVFCRLDPRYEQSKALCSVLRDIYEKAVCYMELHGKEGSGILSSDKKYAIPSGTINESNTSDGLRYPIWFTETSALNPQGRTIKTKDTTVPFTVVLGVGTKGRRATKFCDDTATIIEYTDLKGNGMEHIPLMGVPSIFVGGKENKVRLVMDSSIIVKRLPPAVVRQGTTMKERLQSGKSTAAADMTRKAEEAFSMDGLDNLDSKESSSLDVSNKTDTHENGETDDTHDDGENGNTRDLSKDNTRVSSAPRNLSRDNSRDASKGDGRDRQEVSPARGKQQSPDRARTPSGEVNTPLRRQPRRAGEQR